MNEVCYPLMCLLVSEGRFFTQDVHVAVDIGVGGLIVVTHSVKDLERFLGRRGAIEVDERAVVYATCQNGKITAQCFGIQHNLTLERGYVGHVMTLNMAWKGSMLVLAGSLPMSRLRPTVPAMRKFVNSTRLMTSLST